VLAATLEKGQSVSYPIARGRHAYLAVAKGAATVNDVGLGPRDGAAIHDEAEIRVHASADSEIVLVDAP
jgi:redox-sensitive bicupin YhaK (pirin superfamily)